MRSTADGTYLTSATACIYFYLEKISREIL